MHANGTPYLVAATTNGMAIDRLTQRKHDHYPELVTADRIHFVVLACEEGGRWGPDVFAVVNDLVRLKIAPDLREIFSIFVEIERKKKENSGGRKNC